MRIPSLNTDQDKNEIFVSNEEKDNDKKENKFEFTINQRAGDELEEEK